MPLSQVFLPGPDDVLDADGLLWPAGTRRLTDTDAPRTAGLLRLRLLTDLGPPPADPPAPIDGVS